MSKAKKNFSSKINPCTKTFQALRIFVNREISELVNGLVAATKILKKDGTLAVVTFHSLEDTLVKRIFNFYGKKKSLSRYIPKKNEKKKIIPKRKNINK